MKKKQIINTLVLLISSFLFEFSNAQQPADLNDSGSRVAGVGLGIFVIIIGFAISFCMCICSNATSKPELISFAGMFIPILLIIIFVASPKEFQRNKQVQQEFVTDPQAVTRILLLVVLSLGMIMVLLYWLGFSVMMERQTRKPTNWYRDRDDVIEQQKKKQENEDIIQDNKDKDKQMQEQQPIEDWNARQPKGKLPPINLKGKYAKQKE